MITLQGVSKRFPNETAIDYRDLCFESGKSYMLLGASGCGKSTLLNLIAGILSPSSGSIVIDGQNMTALSVKQRDLYRIAKIGYIYQDFKLLEEMTVWDNIAILRLQGVDISDADRLLERLGIADQKRKKVCRLSGGQKQRVSIARALVKKPDIILADEPTGNLNFAIGRQVMQELREVAVGKTLITVSHDERLSSFFDETVDMNAVTGGRYDTEEN